MNTARVWWHIGKTLVNIYSDALRGSNSLHVCTVATSNKSCCRRGMPICFLRTSVWHSDLIAQPEPRFYSLKMRAFFLSNPLSYRLSCKLRLTNKKWDWQVCSRWSRKDFSCHYRSRREAGKDPVKDEHCARASILTIPFRFLWWCLWLGNHKKKNIPAHEAVSQRGGFPAAATRWINTEPPIPIHKSKIQTGARVGF